jgi:hypothetical protein
MDAVQAGSRSKTARYVHEILVDAAGQYFCPPRKQCDRVCSFSKQSESDRGAIQRMRQQSGHQEEEDEDDEDAAQERVNGSARGVGLCVGLDELVAGLHAIVEWWEEDWRSEQQLTSTDIVEIERGTTRDSFQPLGSSRHVSQLRTYTATLSGWKTIPMQSSVHKRLAITLKVDADLSNKYLPRAVNSPPSGILSRKRALLRLETDSGREADTIIVKRARRERDVFGADGIAEISGLFVYACSPFFLVPWNSAPVPAGLPLITSSQQMSTSVTAASLMIGFTAGSTVSRVDSAWLLSGLRRLFNAVVAEDGGGVDAVTRRLIVFLSRLKLPANFIDMVLRFVRRNCDRRLVGGHCIPSLLYEEFSHEPGSGRQPSVSPSWAWSEGQQRVETQLRPEAFFSSSQSPSCDAHHLQPWEFQPIVLYPLSMREDGLLSVPVALNVVHVVPVTIEAVSGLDDGMRFFDALFEGSSHIEGGEHQQQEQQQQEEEKEEEEKKEEAVSCVTSESTIESSPDDDHEAETKLSPDRNRISDHHEQCSDTDREASAAPTTRRSILKKRPMSMSRIIVRQSPSRGTGSSKRVRFSNTPAIDAVVTDEEEDEALPCVAARYRHTAYDDHHQQDIVEEGFDFFVTNVARTGEHAGNSESRQTTSATPLFGSPVSPPLSSSSSSSSSSSNDSVETATYQSDWLFGSLGSFDFDEEERVTADRFAAATAHKYGKCGKRKEKM